MIAKKLVFLSSHQQDVIVDVAKAMVPFERDIALRWHELYSASRVRHHARMRTARSFRHAVRLLLTSLADGDFNRYLNRVQKAGVSFASIKEHYENLCLFFRFYEEAVMPFLTKAFPKRIDHVRSALEHLYHGIIAIMSWAYFSELEKDRENFLNTLVHDLKNPLIGINGFSNLLLEKDLAKEKEYKFLRIIRDSGDKMSTLIDHALTYGRLKSGKTLVSLGDVDVVEIARESVMFLLPEIEQQLCSVSINKQNVKNWGYLSPIKVRADRELLLRAIGNYLSNAVKYAKSKINVSIKEQDNEILVSVQDDGPGVPPDKHQLLFENYYVVPGGKPGIGIGLASVRMIAELHKGRAWVETANGKGCTFHLAIPKESSV